MLLTFSLKQVLLRLIKTFLGDIVQVVFDLQAIFGQFIESISYVSTYIIYFIIIPNGGIAQGIPY